MESVQFPSKRTPTRSRPFRSQALVFWASLPPLPPNFLEKSWLRNCPKYLTRLSLFFVTWISKANTLTGSKPLQFTHSHITLKSTIKKIIATKNTLRDCFGAHSTNSMLATAYPPYFYFRYVAKWPWNTVKPLCCLETKLRPSFHKYKLNHVVPAQQTSRGVSLQGAANDTVGGKFSNMIPVPLSIYPQRFITIECNRFPIAKQTRSQKNASGACAPDTVALNCSPSRVGGPGVLPPEKVWHFVHKSMQFCAYMHCTAVCHLAATY